MTSITISLPNHSFGHHGRHRHHGHVRPGTVRRLVVGLLVMLAVVIALQMAPSATPHISLAPATTSTQPGPPSAYDMLAGQSR